jgi:hypothetical protein
MDRISKIVTIVGVVCFAWFIICFAMYKWDTLQINMTMGIIGAILIVGGLNVMPSSRRK